MMKFKTLALSLLLGLAASSTFAEDRYLVRVPANVNLAAPGAPAPEETASIALRASALPAGTVGVPYGESQTGFDLSTLLDVTPSSYSLNDISWSITSGVLPSGLNLSSNGLLSGVPTLKDEAGSYFDIQASFKGKADQRSFSIRVHDVLANFAGYIGYADGAYASSCKSYLTGDGVKPAAPNAQNSVYRIMVGGIASDVYCDMEEGGWTLVARVIGTSSAHQSVSKIGTPSDPFSTSVSKLSDADINAMLSSGVMRVKNSAGLVVAYYKGVFSATTPVNMQYSTTENGEFITTCAWKDHSGFSSWCGYSVSPSGLGAVWGHYSAPSSYKGLGFFDTWNSSGTVWVK